VDLRLVSLVAALATLSASQPRADESAASVQADLRRALTMVGPSASEEPALRDERRARDPSPAFLLGAALGAWINAAGQLNFDRDHPTAAGPPHVSQSGADPDALAQDCAEERLAFAHLQARAGAMDMPAEQVVRAASVDPAVVAGWRTRSSAQPPICR
jgi:hypothetical protein